MAGFWDFLTGKKKSGKKGAQMGMGRRGRASQNARLMRNIMSSGGSKNIVRESDYQVGMKRKKRKK